jgi:hypothetical protein
MAHILINYSDIVELRDKCMLIDITNCHNKFVLKGYSYDICSCYDVLLKVPELQWAIEIPRMLLMIEKNIV